MKRPESPLLAILLIAYLAFGCLYSVVTPIFEASDELWHYPMVKYLADHTLALPVQDPHVSTAWRQEGSQPPLYYMIGAALTFWIDTSDLDTVRNINPHADIGIVVPDGNVNMIVHNPALEAFPWHGTVLAVHLLRFLSVALGAVTVAMTYLLALELFPGRRGLALAAAAFTAFNPMFLFISGSANNDNLSNALASVLLVLIARLLKRTTRPAIRELVLIGAVAGAGMLAKFNIGFLLPLIALALALLAYRLRDGRFFVTGALITGGLTTLIAGWWYVRNAQLYGDVTGIDMMIRIAGPRTIPANLAQLWSERHTFLMSYWGFFGGINVPLPDVMYAVFNGIALIAVVGLGIGAIRSLPHPQPLSVNREGSQRRTDSPSLRAERGPGGEVGLTLARAMTILWIVVLFGSLLRWTSLTWASQGRLMFSAIAPLSIWMTVGLWELGRLVPLIRWRLLAVGTAWFIVASSAAMLVISLPYNVAFWTGNLGKPDGLPFYIIATFTEPGQQHPALELRSWPITDDATPSQAKVGHYFVPDYVPYFVVKQPFTRNWSAVIHLENSDGLIVAQRDVYLLQGLGATTFLKVGDEWKNYFAVHIPDYAYAPQTLNVYLSLYDLKSPTYERMIAQGPNVFADNRVYLGTVQLLPRDSALGVPNPMSVNFGGEAELVGYDVSSLLMYPGQKVTVTLYWRELHPLTTSYRVFSQIVEPNTTRVFGNGDSMPANWSRPTTTWKPGEIVKDEHTFTINADAPPGTWQIAVGMYEPTPGNGFRRLRVVTPDGDEADDFVTLSRIKMLLPPDEF